VPDAAARQPRRPHPRPGLGRRHPGGRGRRGRDAGDGLMTALEVAVELCDDIAAIHRDRRVLPWMWGPALLGFALAKLDEHLDEDRYLSCLERYGDHYLDNPPSITYSDHVA